MLKRCTLLVKAVLTPKGSVHPEYSKYIRWTFISTVASSAQGTLSTHTMLSTLSTCNNEIAFSYNFIGKDLLGQIGAMWIIHKGASKIDNNIKKCANKNIILENISTLGELITPFCKDMFLPIATLSNVGKNICWTRMGAINAKCIQVLAKDGNVAEIYTYISIINSIGSSLGSALGLILIAAVPDNCTRNVIFFPMLSIIRYATYAKSIGFITKNNN